MPLEHPLPSGMRDLLPEDAALRRTLAQRALEATQLFGYQLVTPPPFEFADVLERGLGTLDPAEVLRFVEPESGEVAALRPDMTPQVARMIATRLGDRPPPYRLAYEGTVLRRRGGRARPRRQIPQVGVELAGAPHGDREVLEVLAAALEAAGLRRFTIDIGDSGVVRGLLEGASEPAQRALLLALAQRDEALVLELGRLHRVDVGALVELQRASSLEHARELVRGTSAAAAVERLARLAEEVDLGDRLTVDLGEVRDFAYYTGTLIHAYAEGPGHAIATGGRYDELLGRFGTPMPAVGFAIDLDALAAALRAARALPGLPLRALSPDRALAARLHAAGVVCAVSHERDLDEHARAWGYTVVRTEDDALMMGVLPRKSG